MLDSSLPSDCGQALHRWGHGGGKARWIRSLLKVRAVLCTWREAMSPSLGRQCTGTAGSKTFPEEVASRFSSKVSRRWPGEGGGWPRVISVPARGQGPREQAAAS